MKSEDFEKVKIIGRGAFGEVQLVRIGCQLCRGVYMAAVSRHTKSRCLLSTRSVIKHLRRSMP